jgi:hypothetical protein
LSECEKPSASNTTGHEFPKLQMWRETQRKAGYLYLAAPSGGDTEAGIDTFDLNDVFPQSPPAIPLDG